MNVLFVLPAMSCAGAEILVGDIAIELCVRGNKVKVVCLHPSYDSFKNFPNKEKFIELTNPEIINSKVNFSVTHHLKVTAPQLGEIYQSFQPDIIHSHLFEAEVVSRSVPYLKAKWFSHCHDNMRQFEAFHLLKLASRAKLMEYYEKLYVLKKYRANGGNRFIAISNDAYNYFNRVLPKDLRNITLLPNAVNTAKFKKPANHQRKRIAKIELVTVGSFVDKKNQTFLIDVMNLLVKKRYGHSSAYFGRWNKSKKVGRKAAKLHLTKNISFHGNIARVEEYLWNSDICVHSAYYEPFGLVLIEAMSAGLPIVCLDGKGNRDIIKDGENGFMLSENSVEVFAEKILQLMNDKNLYNKIKAGALQTASRYDIVNYTDKLLALYKKVLAE